jgi:hypothetical protein
MSNRKIYPEPLGTVFLAGLDGCVYEIPEEVALTYRITSARIKELGHLPIAAKHAGATEPEVVGHHYVIGPDGTYGPHSYLLFGTAIASDGRYYSGWHRHPHSTELAEFEKRDDIPLV